MHLSHHHVSLQSSRQPRHPTSLQPHITQPSAERWTTNVAASSSAPSFWCLAKLVGWGFWVARVGIGGDWLIILTAVYLLLFAIVWLPPLVILVLVVVVGYGVFLLLLQAAISWLIHHPPASISILVAVVLLGVIGTLGEWLESRPFRPRSCDPEASAERSVYSPVLPRPGGSGKTQPPEE